MTPSERKEFDTIVNSATDADLASMDTKTLKNVMADARALAVGRHAVKTRETRGEEPPTYSTGSRGSVGGHSMKPKPKHTLEQKAAIQLAKESGLTEDETIELLGLD
jgi:hypothetical protein